MPALTNRRREAFALSVANGVGRRESAVAAGYSPKRAPVTASELAKVREVAVRIDEIRQAFAESVLRHTSYTIVQAMAEANQALELAKANGNAGHMISAITLKARLAGLLIERASVTYTNVDELSDAQLETLIESAESSNDTGFTH